LAAGKEGGPPFYEQLEDLRELTIEVAGELNNIHLMDQGEIVLRNKDIAVIGATGWATGGGGSAETETIWKVAGQRISKKDIERWHYEDMSWLRERNAWWGMHHPYVRKVILTHDMWMERPIHGINSPILGHLPPRAPYAWLSGAGGATISGMTRKTFLATNGLRAEEGGAINRFYSPDRCLEIPLPRRRGWTGGSPALAPALVLA
jgi:hypothetical protein